MIFCLHSQVLGSLCLWFCVVILSEFLHGNGGNRRFWFRDFWSRRFRGTSGIGVEHELGELCGRRVKYMLFMHLDMEW